MQSDTFRGYNGYLIETPHYRVVFGGDTAIAGHFANCGLHARLDMAIMPIGAYNPWIRALHAEGVADGERCRSGAYFARSSPDVSAQP